MAELLRFLISAAFVALLVRVRVAPAGARRRRVDQLALYTLVASVAICAAQWDAWPITQYRLAAYRPDPERRLCQLRLFGETADGQEWLVDPYAWSPLYASTLQYWLELHLATLSEVERGEVGAFLLRRAEAARSRLAGGAAIGYERRLGLLHASYWWQLPRSREAPAEPLEAIVVHRLCLVPAEWPRGAAWQRQATSIRFQ